MLSKTQFPDVNILNLAFFGPLIGALARSAGGMISGQAGRRTGDADQLRLYGHL